ncbi:MAG: RsmB/NOP family class I SAM-dependent RNA methyltransferase [Treponema sp.]|nr:RsmB/NOP family class I SAM-dependent RNA methyltransferase [Treponema sp.]
MEKKNKLNGKDGFNSFYENFFHERWLKIKNAFEKEPSYVQFKIESHEVADEEKYFLDKASYFVATQLSLENAEKILDMCAAPGGKSLVIASRMKKGATLVCNERSAERRNRLIKNLHIQLPENIYSRIIVTGNDGALMCLKNREVFDAIFLDAPCSSERHVYNSEHHLKKWTVARTKNLSYTQWSLLSSAFLLLKEDGVLVYATCSLSPAENDNVIEKLLKKHKNVTIKKIDMQEKKDIHKKNFYFDELFLEKTKYGYAILPDVSNGAGPMYFCLVKKLKLR